MVEDMAAVIDGSHLFKSLDEEGRSRVLELGYVRAYDAGDVVIRQYDPGDAMYVVLNGKVRVETESAAGIVQLAELGRGACLGEVSVLTGQARTATVTALESVDAVAFAKHRIERVLADYPKVRHVLETIVESRARNTIEKIIG